VYSRVVGYLRPVKTVEHGKTGRIQDAEGVPVLIPMKIAGIQRVSLIDYPGRIGATIFTQGCNFRCGYCHNAELVSPDQYGPLIEEDDIFAFLRKRAGKLEAVTVTGGEPTIQDDLAGFSAL